MTAMLDELDESDRAILERTRRELVEEHNHLLAVAVSAGHVKTEPCPCGEYTYVGCLNRDAWQRMVVEHAYDGCGYATRAIVTLVQDGHFL